jgi:pyroglutamyl-peptidase
MKLLITGFEPFGGSDVNPSCEALRVLGEAPPDGIELHTALLPVEHRRGPEELLRNFEQNQPEAVICLGEAGRRMRLSIERVAVNLIDDQIPDNEGQLLVDSPVFPGGPAAYFVTLPVREMLQAILKAGVPAELSLTAGAYLCNQVLYTILHRLAEERLSIPAGFIHLPQLPEQVAALQTAHTSIPSKPSMALETQVCGLKAAILALKDSINRT